MQQLTQFFKALTGPARFCCCAALVSLLTSFYAWFPLSSHPARLVLFLSLAAIAAGLVAFISIARNFIVSWENRKAPQPKIRLPYAFWFSAFSSFGYFLAVFFGIFILYPHGVDLGPSVYLRVASAAALFFGISALGFTQWAGLRSRALQSAP